VPDEKENEENKKEEKENRRKMKNNKNRNKIDGEYDIRENDISNEEDDSLSEDYIDNLVQTLLSQALGPSQKVTKKKEEKKDKEVIVTDKEVNALDAILKNLFAESYTESADLTEDRKTKAKTKKTTSKPVSTEKPSRKSSKLKENNQESRETVTEGDLNSIVDVLYKQIVGLGKTNAPSSVRSNNSKGTKNSKKDASNKEEERDPKEVEAKEEDTFGAVQEALTFLIGDNPSEEEKLSAEEFKAVIELDKFLRTEEEQRKRKENEVDSLLKTALEYVDSAVDRREEAEGRLRRLNSGLEGSQEEERLEKVLEELDLSPSDLAAILAELPVDGF